MKLTVFGATGGIGGEVVRQALAAGHTVTAVVRDPARFAVEEDPALHVATVPDLTDVPLLTAALSGSDVAISGIGPRKPKDVTVASSTTRAILTALTRSGVARFLAVSAAPVGPTPDDEGFLNRRLLYPITRRLLRRIYGDLAVMEADIAASGLRWTVVRPPRLHDKPRGEYRTAIGANVPRGHFAARAEVAHAMLAMVDDPDTFGKAVGIAR
jgi:uncharacterized protein YbjT (DUF2867 family)